MKYHLLPIENPRNRQKIVTDKEVCDAAKELLGLVSIAITKTNKREQSSSFKEPFFLYDQKSMTTLMSMIENGDEIILHGEGQPFVIGLEVPCEQYDLNAYKLASLLERYGMPDRNISINLLSCNSGLDYKDADKKIDINFTRDMSRALHFLFDYNNISVIGYTGFIVDKEKAGKYSVSSGIDNDKGKRSTHASLEEASVEYKQNVEVKTGRVLGNLANIAFSWASPYILKAHAGNMEVKIEEAKALKIEEQRKFKHMQAEVRSDALKNDVEPSHDDSDTDGDSGPAVP